MNSKDMNQLESELRDAGASSSEVNNLAKVAISLRDLNGQEPGFTIRQAAPRPLFRTRIRVLIAGLSTVAIVGAGIAIASIAQTAFPGNFLYPVKRFTENVAVIAQPSYRGTVMMQRAQEVKQLVALNKNSRLIDATLQSYKLEAAAYKGGNYADYEYCENTLRQAENMSSGENRLAIAETISIVKADSD
jgi:hypothetical protein